MKEEDLIRKITEGKPNPFKVPEDYFDNFTERLMSQLPQQEEKKKTSNVRPLWRWAAAVAVVAAAGIASYMAAPDNDLVASDTNTELIYEQYSNDALDYAMLDNQDIEMFLTEAQ